MGSPFTVQIWDHNCDGSIIFNLLYTFEKDNRIFQKELFEEHYYPFKKDAAVEKILSMGYDEIELKPVPCEEEETDFDKIRWYQIIARKK